MLTHCSLARRTRLVWICKKDASTSAREVTFVSTSVFRNL